jgi:predicted RNA-binding Zn ribbon-like protein
VVIRNKHLSNVSVQNPLAKNAVTIYNGYMIQNKQLSQTHVMHPQRQARDFRFDTGRLCLDFVATVGWRLDTPLERLPLPGDLARWFVEAHLCETALSVSASQHTGALALREAIYRTALAILSHSTPAGSDVILINAWAAHPIALPQLDGATLRVCWQAVQPVEAALATVARDAVELLGGRDGELLGACEGLGCGMLFINGSRSKRRRWCSMAECGNLSKVHGYRQRRKGISPE